VEEWSKTIRKFLKPTPPPPVSNPPLILHRVRGTPSKIPHFIVKSPKLWYILGSPNPLIGNLVKHLLIILSFLLLSSPVIGNSHKGETLYRWGECCDYKWMGFGEKDTNPKYQGQVKDGIPNGLGYLFFPNGWKYVGSWKDGKENGKGTLTSPNGEKYEGEWKDGLPNGKGVFTFGKGKWEGDKYIGEHKDGKKHGQGIYTFTDGRKYEGEWKDGKYHGQGTLTHPNGEKYVGEFKKGKRHGQGIHTYPNGEKYEGEYTDGENWNGTGYDKNGNIQVKFVNGKMIDP